MPKVRSNFWCNFEQFIGGKIPDFIKIILIECGFEDEISIGQINESAIEKIEEYVRKNKELLKDIKFENEENFVFLLGHRCLLLELPNKVRDFIESKPKRSKKGSNKINENIDEESAKNGLIQKLNNYSEKFSLGFVIRSENISQLEKVEQNFKCKVHCPFLVCTCEKICTFKAHWEVSNFIKHVKSHYEFNYEEISVLVTATEPEIQRIEEHSDLNNILR